MNRGRAVWSLLAVGMALAGLACGPKRPGAPSPPSGDLIVLLPDRTTGAIGQIVVSNPSGSVDIGGSRQATEVRAGQAPSAPRDLDEATVRRIFGDALSAVPPDPDLFTLYFEFESNQLTAESRKLLPAILDLVVKARPAPEVIVIGHTDTTGGAAANLALGLKRAATVRQLLIDTGIEASLVEINSHGEGNPLIKTPDNTPEPRNRRVEIAVR
jgi:outer membrane protein OmpA-like peptidoglycan-associated protein